MTVPRFGLAGLALLLFLAWAGPARAESGRVPTTPEDAGDMPSASAQAPALELRPITEVEMRAVTPPVTREAAWAHARASAWLAALHRAVIAFPQRREIRMGAVAPAERLALAAQLYRAAAPPLADAPNAAKAPDTAEDSPLHVALSLTPRSQAGTELILALRNPELLALRHTLISETRDTLEIMDRHWPGGTAALQPATPGVKTPEVERDFWQTRDWQRMSARLNGLWLAQAALDLTPEGWLTGAEALSTLERATREAPRSPTVRLLLAEAQLQRNLPQQSIESCTEALRLAPGSNLISGRARYIRALAHWRLQQLALAEDDLNAALHTRTPSAPQGAEQARRLRARGAVRMLRRNYPGMCADFSAACALGDCEGLAVARAQKYCRTRAAAAPESGPASLPPSFLAAPAGQIPENTEKQAPEPAQGNPMNSDKPDRPEGEPAS
ncbi:translation initiation factor IF-2 [Desulfovibrio sp. 6_1_46AFAA]|uniref:translation initiation factor IF-2 n=1 Tax=Desulfovibrio sp. 6_1_46AFAA TaxID=665942 RepID=UPI001E59B086|nr:translation initiation factor IF-2 [Desulfovibrio sp. 6_1_46AFAA]